MCYNPGPEILGSSIQAAVRMDTAVRVVENQVYIARSEKVN
ncbi:MAG: hypothetical protein WDW21_04560 [Neisseriaceae bacterium]